MITAVGRSRAHPDRRLLLLVLRVVIVVTLAVDAVVHLRLAPGYQQSAPTGVGAGSLFRVEAAAALLVGVWVLWRGSRASFFAAFAVGLSACAAVVLYRYVDLPALGLIPAMYEPIWFMEKSLSAASEGLAAAASAAGLVLLRRRDLSRESRDRPSPEAR